MLDELFDIEAKLLRRPGAAGMGVETPRPSNSPGQHASKFPYRNSPGGAHHTLNTTVAVVRRGGASVGASPFKSPSRGGGGVSGTPTPRGYSSRDRESTAAPSASPSYAARYQQKQEGRIHRARVAAAMPGAGGGATATATAAAVPDAGADLTSRVLAGLQRHYSHGEVAAGGASPAPGFTATPRGTANVRVIDAVPADTRRAGGHGSTSPTATHRRRRSASGGPARRSGYASTTSTSQGSVNNIRNVSPPRNPRLLGPAAPPLSRGVAAAPRTAPVEPSPAASGRNIVRQAQQVAVTQLAAAEEELQALLAARGRGNAAAAPPPLPLAQDPHYISVAARAPSPSPLVYPVGASTGGYTGVPLRSEPRSLSPPPPSGAPTPVAGPMHAQPQQRTRSPSPPPLPLPAVGAVRGGSPAASAAAAAAAHVGSYLEVSPTEAAGAAVGMARAATAAGRIAAAKAALNDLAETAKLTEDLNAMLLLRAQGRGEVRGRGGSISPSAVGQDIIVTTAPGGSAGVGARGDGAGVEPRASATLTLQSAASRSTLPRQAPGTRESRDSDGMRYLACGYAEHSADDLSAMTLPLDGRGTTRSSRQNKETQTPDNDGGGAATTATPVRLDSASVSVSGMRRVESVMTDGPGGASPEATMRDSVPPPGGGVSGVVGVGRQKQISLTPSEWLDGHPSDSNLDMSYGVRRVEALLRKHETSKGPVQYESTATSLLDPETMLAARHSAIKSRSSSLIPDASVVMLSESVLRKATKADLGLSVMVFDNDYNVVVPFEDPEESLGVSWGCPDGRTVVAQAIAPGSIAQHLLLKPGFKLREVCGVSVGNSIGRAEDLIAAARRGRREAVLRISETLLVEGVDSSTFPTMESQQHPNSLATRRESQASASIDLHGSTVATTMRAAATTSRDDDEAAKTLALHDARVHDLEAILAERDAALVALKASLHDARRGHDAKDTQVAELEQQLAAAQGEVVATNDNLRMCKDVLEEHEVELHKALGELASYRAQTDAAAEGDASITARAREQVAAAEAAAGAAAKEAADLMAMLQAAEARQQAHAEGRDEEIAALQSQVMAARDGARAAESQRLALRADLRSAEARLAEAEAAVAAAETHCDEQVADVEARAATRVNALEAQLAKAEGRIDQLCSEQGVAAAEVRKAKTAADGAAAEHEATLQRVADAHRIEIDAREEQWGARLAAGEREREVLKMRVDELKAMLDKRDTTPSPPPPDADNAVLRTRIIDLEVQVQERDTAAQVAAGRVERLQARVHELEAQAGAGATGSAELRVDVARLNAQAATDRAEAASLRSRIAELEAQVGGTSGAAGDAGDEQLRARVGELEAQLRAAQQLQDSPVFPPIPGVGVTGTPSTTFTGASCNFSVGSWISGMRTRPGSVLYLDTCVVPPDDRLEECWSPVKLVGRKTRTLRSTPLLQCVSLGSVGDAVAAGAGVGAAAAGGDAARPPPTSSVATLDEVVGVSSQLKLTRCGDLIVDKRLSQEPVDRFREWPVGASGLAQPAGDAAASPRVRKPVPAQGGGGDPAAYMLQQGASADLGNVSMNSVPELLLSHSSSNDGCRLPRPRPVPREPGVLDSGGTLDQVHIQATPASTVPVPLQEGGVAPAPAAAADASDLSARRVESTNSSSASVTPTSSNRAPSSGKAGRGRLDELMKRYDAHKQTSSPRCTPMDAPLRPPSRATSTSLEINPEFCAFGEGGSDVVSPTARDGGAHQSLSPECPGVIRSDAGTPATDLALLDTADQQDAELGVGMDGSADGDGLHVRAYAGVVGDLDSAAHDADDGMGAYLSTPDDASRGEGAQVSPESDASPSDREDADIAAATWQHATPSTATARQCSPAGYQTDLVRLKEARRMEALVDLEGLAADINGQRGHLAAAAAAHTSLADELRDTLELILTDASDVYMTEDVEAMVAQLEHLSDDVEHGLKALREENAGHSEEARGLQGALEALQMDPSPVRERP